MKKLSLSLAALALVVGFAGTARADEQQAETAQKGRGVITLPERVITGRAQRPQAAIAINKLSQHGTLAVLDLPLVGRIEAVIVSDPF